MVLKTWLISWHFFGMNRKCQISEAQLVAQSSKKAKQTMQLLLLISLRNYPKIQIFSTCNWISQFSHIFKWFNDALKTRCKGCGFAKRIIMDYRAKVTSSLIKKKLYLNFKEYEITVFQNKLLNWFWVLTQFYQPNLLNFFTIDVLTKLRVWDHCV